MMRIAVLCADALILESSVMRISIDCGVPLSRSSAIVRTRPATVTQGSGVPGAASTRVAQSA